jgi:hypothetical protein
MPAGLICWLKGRIASTPPGPLRSPAMAIRGRSLVAVVIVFRFLAAYEAIYRSGLDTYSPPGA